MGKTRVYVGRLSSRTRERDIEDAFSKFGKIVSVDLKFGFAFVEFDDSRDAEDCVRDMDGRDLDGSRIAVEFSNPDRRSRGGAPRRGEYRARIEGLPRDSSWQDLKDHFRRVSEAVFTDVVRDRSGRAKGIVEFRTSEDLKKAIKELDGSSLRGHTLTIKEDNERSRSPRRRRRSSRSKSRSRSPRRRRRSSRSKSRSRSPRGRSPSPRRGRSSSRSKSPSSPVKKGGKSKSRSRSRSKSKSKSRSRSRSASPASTTTTTAATAMVTDNGKSPTPQDATS